MSQRNARIDDQHIENANSEIKALSSNIQMENHGSKQDFLKYVNPDSQVAKFLDDDLVVENFFKITKAEILKTTFEHNLDMIYDAKVSRLDKIRKILLSPQFDLVIIFLVIIDVISALGELVTDIFRDKGEFSEHFEDFVEYLSFTLVSLFVVEICFRAILIPKYFFRSKLECFDAIVVIVSFVLELLFILRQHEFNGMGSVLTILRYYEINKVH